MNDVSLTADPEVPASQPEAEGADAQVAPASPEASASVQDAVAARSMTAGMSLSVRRRLGGAAIALLVVSVIVMVVSVIVSAIRGPQGPWRGEFFDNQQFKGDPRIRFSRKIENEYKKDAPFRGMPADDWSAIWTTCMTVEESTKMRIRVSSDDGSRFYIDDELVVDNWGLHAPRTRSGRRELEPGVYHLRLDYYEAKHGAVIKLLASFDDDTEYEAIPPQMLHQPEGGDDPCGD